MSKDVKQKWFIKLCWPLNFGPDLEFGIWVTLSQILRICRPPLYQCLISYAANVIRRKDICLICDGVLACQTQSQALYSYIVINWGTPNEIISFQFCFLNVGSGNMFKTGSPCVVDFTAVCFNKMESQHSLRHSWPVPQKFRIKGVKDGNKCQPADLQQR